MVPRIHVGGKSFAGVVQYLTHDAAIPGDRHPTTGERVGWVAVENMADCQPREAAVVMRGTARDAAVLKELAGGSAKGRALAKPVYHYSLSWAKDERPTRDEMLTAARASLQTLGMRDRQTLIVQHTDRAHPHCHIVVNRVSPADGRAASTSHDAKALSAWARTWERARGGVRCHGRPWPLGERVVELATRVVSGRTEPPYNPPPQPRRGPGRDGRGGQDRQAWAALYARQRLEARDKTSGRSLENTSSDPHHRIERRELAQAQRDQAEAERVKDIRRQLPTYKRGDAAWQQWNGIPRDNDGARALEPRLPHVGGVLAVSDWTFTQLLNRTSWDMKPAIAAMHLDHLATNNGEQRQQAEDAHYVNPQAVDAEQRRQGAANAAAYRAGTRHTPHVPSWKEAAFTLLGTVVERALEVVKRAYRELPHLSASSNEANRRHDWGHDPVYGPGYEGGIDLHAQRLAREAHQRQELERIRAERERVERDRGPDLDFGPSR